jgi:signal transduction histidine kinase
MSSVLTRLLKTEGFRLSAIYAGVFALSVLAMGAIVLLITDQTLRDQVVQYSRTDLAAIQNGYRSQGVKEAHEVIGQIIAAPEGSGFLLLQQNNKILAGNLAAMPPHIGVLALPGARPGHDILGVGTFLAPGIYAFAGSDLYRVHAAQQRIIITLLWLFGAGIVLAIAGGALVSRSFLRRTDAMAKACHAIMDGNMTMRIPVRGSGDELDRLAGAINEMLDRIAGLMENLRQVTNDIAHDLRTPVSHLRNRLERARSESSTADDYAAAVQAAIVKSDEILALFNALLRIAQLEGGTRRAAFAPVNLPALLSHVGELFGAVAEEADHHLETELCDFATIRGDRQLLIQLFSNLIENAILHTPAGSRIILSLSVSAGYAVVSVSDNGPGVPRAEHDKLFQRLYRREASRTRPGYGLGLAMVAAVAELHGACVKIVEQSTPGLCIRIAFPLIAEAPE